MTSSMLALYAWTAVDNALLVRARDYRRLALRNLIGGSLSGILQLAVAIWVPSVAALALAMLVGRGIAMLLTRPNSTSGLQVIGDGVDHLEYTGRRAATTVLLGTISTAVLQALTLVTAATLGARAAGLVGTTQRVAGAPTSFISQGIGQLVQGRFAPVFTSDSQKSFRQTLSKTLVPLGLLSVVIAAGLAACGPLLAEPLLGPEWADVGPLLAIVAIPTALQFLIGALNPLFVMAGAEKKLLVQQVLRLLLSVGGAAVAAVTTEDLVTVVIVFGSITTLAYAANLVLLIALSRQVDFERRQRTAST